MSKLDLMIDIETLGTSTGAAITQIAAVYFDRNTCQPTASFQVYVRPAPEAVIDIDTVIWWLGQSDGARKALVEGMKSSLSEAQALQNLILFIKDNGAPNTVWAQGQDFDFGHLKSAFERNLRDAPWKFWTARDTRTVYDVMGLNYHKERESYFKNHPEMSAHNAVGDCLSQIHCLGAALKANVQ